MLRKVRKKGLIRLGCVLMLVAMLVLAVSGCAAGDSPQAQSGDSSKASASGEAQESAPAPKEPEKWMPKKPITLIVPTKPGDYYDSQARVIGAELEKALGQPVTIEYMPGAGHAVAAEYVYGASPDGYVLGYCALQPTVINKLVFNKNYDFNKFTYFPTCYNQTNDKAFLYVPVAAKDSKSGLNSWEDVINSEKPLRWASVGEGSVVHVAGVVLAKYYDFDIVQVLGYTGGPDCVTAVARGEADLTTMTIDVLGPYFKEGDVKPVFSIGRGRSDLYPDIPSLSDDYPELVELLSNKHFIVGPPDMPKEVADTLEEAIWNAVNSDAMQQLHKTSISEGRQYGPTPGDETKKSVEKMSELFEPLIPLFEKK